ncbi:P2Y purinoceptor 14 isoform X1 [Nelusetta ayraudi]|uniref:P2Y purinoceptor 14 isoform X1 n=2 Tax=Nelusetta ayraudi TaxID=303726 RepID=UPI003F6ED5EF
MALDLEVMDLFNSSHLPSNQSDLSSVFTLHVLPPLYFLVGVAGAALNGAAACIFFRVPSDSGLVVYLKNMVVADLLMSATYPFRLAAELELGGWRLRVAMCRYVAVLFYSSMYVGIVFMGLISLDRYVKVVRHGSAPPPSSGGPSPRLRGVGVARLLALFTWSFLLLCVLPNVLLTSLPANRESSRHCMQLKTPLGVQWHRVTALFNVALFWLTLLLLTFCYASIARRVYRSGRRLRPQQGSMASRRSGRSIASLVLVFALCFVPYHVTRVPYTLSQMPAAEFSRDARFLLFQLKEATLFLSALNVCLDPVIYFLMCRHFRDSLLRKLSGRRSLNAAQSLSNM